MVVKRIMCLTEWDDNAGIENGNVDILVELEDSYTYVVVVATVQNIEYLMNQQGIKYFSPGHPFLLVKDLTKEIVKQAIQVYAEKNDGYWLKFYHFAGDIDKTIFEELQAKRIQKLRDE